MAALRRLDPKSMKVSKYMTDKLVVAKPSDGSRQVFFRMRELGIRHMPVVDGDNKLLGIISDRDLRRPDWAEEAIDVSHVYRLDDNLTVGDLMTTNVTCVHTYDSLRKAAGIFIARRYGALPVLNKEQELVGILSPIDLLRALEDGVEA